MRHIVGDVVDDDDSDTVTVAQPSGKQSSTHIKRQASFPEGGQALITGIGSTAPAWPRGWPSWDAALGGGAAAARQAAQLLDQVGLVAQRHVGDLEILHQPLMHPGQRRELVARGLLRRADRGDLRLIRLVERDDHRSLPSRAVS
jgi:hypothetical protein